MRIHPIWNLTLALAITGCVAADEATDGDEPTSETTSAISVAGGATWHGTTRTVLGPTNQQTCFLTGISGAFIGDPALYGEPSEFLPAEVKVYPNDATGMWELNTSSGVGTGVQAGVICVNVPYTSNKVHELNWEDNLAIEGYTGTANTHCFLRDVWATTGLDTYEAPFTPHIELEHHSVGGGQVEWDMNQSYVHNYAGDYDFGGAIAVCIEFPATGQWGYTFDGQANELLRNSYPSGAPVATSGTACGITGIIGDWVAGGFSNGVILDNTTADWKVAAASGRDADVTCIH